MIASVARRSIVWALWLLVVAAVPSEAQPAPRNVLILSSFDRDFAPHRSLLELYRTDLSRQSSEPVNFFEVSIRPAPFGHDP
jgi:hypothetical protein